jgi:hypothetical protein
MQDTQLYRDIGHLMTMSGEHSRRFEKVETSAAGMAKEIKAINVTLTKVTAVWAILKRAILAGGLLASGAMVGLNSKELATIVSEILKKSLTGI